MKNKRDKTDHVVWKIVAKFVHKVSGVPRYFSVMAPEFEYVVGRPVTATPMTYHKLKRMEGKHIHGFMGWCESRMADQTGIHVFTDTITSVYVPSAWDIRQVAKRGGELVLIKLLITDAEFERKWKENLDHADRDWDANRYFKGKFTTNVKHVKEVLGEDPLLKFPTKQDSDRFMSWSDAYFHPYSTY